MGLTNKTGYENDDSGFGNYWLHIQYTSPFLVFILSYWTASSAFSLVFLPFGEKVLLKTHEKVDHVHLYLCSPPLVYELSLEIWILVSYGPEPWVGPHPSLLLKCGLLGVPIVAQQKRIWRVTTRTQVRSLASLSGLRIRHHHKLWCRSQMRLGSGIAVVMV